MVARTRELTSKPFGVAIVLAFPYEEILKHIYAEKIAFLQVYFGDFPKARVDEAHAAGVKVLHQVISLSPKLRQFGSFQCVVGMFVDFLVKISFIIWL